MATYGSNNYGNSGIVTSITRSGSTTATIYVRDYGLTIATSTVVVITGVNTEFNKLWTVVSASSVPVTGATATSPGYDTILTVTTGASTTLNLTGLTGTVASSTENKFYYGVSSATASVAPFVATAYDYSKVFVQWTTPSMTAGLFSHFRLLRNQDGVSDNAEDGVILKDITDSATLALDNGRFNDGVDVPAKGTAVLIPGKYVFYSIWLLKSDGWKMAGQTRALVASQHANAMWTDPTTGVVTYSRNTHQKLMDLIPRVFTSATQSPLDEVDTTSDLYTFLRGFSYTLDELLTYTDLLLPKHTAENLSPELLNIKSYELGLTTDNRVSSKFQRQLVREAYDIYSRKGTSIALSNAIESMSGYAAAITPSPNKLLSPQDSTFRGSIGNWRAVGNTTFAMNVFNPGPTQLQEPQAVDLSYTAKAVVGTAGAKVTNGDVSPILYGIPVAESTAYDFSLYADSDSTSSTITLKVYWYDRKGLLLGNSGGTTPVTLNGTPWLKVVLNNISSPTSAVYASLEVTFNNVDNYYLDMVQFAAHDVAELYAFHEAGGVEIQLTPNKVNYLPNPSFELAPSGQVVPGWNTLTGGTPTQVLDTTPPGILSGIYRLKVATVSASTLDLHSIVSLSPPPAPLPGNFYTFSIYARADTPIASLSLVTSATGSFSVTNTTAMSLTTSWQRFQVTTFIPANFGTVNVQFGVSGAMPAGQVVYFDAAQVEANYSASDYFDGSDANDGGKWSATANNSISYMYSNFAYKIPRLTQEIPKYIPLGNAYTVSSQSKVEFSGFA